MTIVAGNVGNASDFVTVSAGAAAQGKVPKLDATGRVDKSTTPSDTVYTAALPAVTDRVDGVGDILNYLYSNDTLKLNSALWTAYAAHTISTFGEEYGSSISATTIRGSYRAFGVLDAIKFSTKAFIVEMDVKLAGTTNSNLPGWGVGTTADSITDCLTSATAVGGGDALGLRVNAAGSLIARAYRLTGNLTTEVTITGVTLTNRNRYRIEYIPGTSALFYVNGVLKATISTNLPNDATNQLVIGYGHKGAAAGFSMTVGAPRVSY